MSKSHAITVLRPATAPPINSFDLNDLKNRGYIIGKKIGTGAYATVSKAYYLNENKHHELLAVKIINKKKAPKDFLLKFFPRELDIIAKISHPSIIQTHSILQRGDKFFIFMRYAENGDLLNYLQANKAISEIQAKFWCHQMADGLKYLHSLNIAHRDMKCENILITIHMNVKIADFGFCRYCCNEENHRVLSRTYCGSGAYAAPEVITGVPYNPKLADNWSMGIIVFIMIDGSMPFDDANLLKLMNDQKKRKYKLKQNCSDMAREVINHLLEPDVILRWKMNDVLNSKWIKSGEKSELQIRVIKSPSEIEVLKYVAKISCDGHKRLMRTVKPGSFEYQAESEFLHHCYSIGGCRHASYTCTSASGDNASIMHYGHAAAPNDKLIYDGELLLFDMGANYFGYAADITCTFPANGKFTEDQKLIYNAVLAASVAVLGAAREGVSWVDMHKLANRVMLGKLKDGGLLKGDVNDMMAAGINGVFQPAGLGHLLGLDVHDVGGYLDECPTRPIEKGLTNLRFARELKAGMYLTIEPGCYFIDHLLDKALSDPIQKQFLVPEIIARFRNTGGVRIEDDVLITKDGCENFSVLPRTVEDIEAFMAAGGTA